MTRPFDRSGLLRRWAAWGLAGGLASPLLSGCEKPADSPPPPATASALAPKAPAAKPSRTREAAAAQRLGTLPEGLGLAPQSRLPDVAASNAAGVPVALRALATKSPLLVVFYRGGWCPYCNFQIRSYAEAAEAFQARGVMPVAISVDKLSESARTQAAHSVPFPVLSDSDLTVHRAFKVLNPINPAGVKRLEGFGIDLEHASGRAHHTVAIPSVFLVDTAGVVQWAHADTDYKSRPTVEQLLQVLEEKGYKPG